jgi:hypothetical protein
LNAGVLEDGKRIRVEGGTPQGGSASPLLANIYLHYAFDLRAQAWRRKQAHGDVILVRYADDIVVGFQNEEDATQFRTELAERFRKFSLELHPDKTRLLEFGPFAARNRKRRGEGKPETFDFLFFTHICGKKRSNGYFTVMRRTIRKRQQAKLNSVKAELRQRMHAPILGTGKWLRSVVNGHIRYYGAPMNRQALSSFRFKVGRLWHDPYSDSRMTGCCGLAVVRKTEQQVVGQSCASRRVERPQTMSLVLEPKVPIDWRTSASWHQINRLSSGF